jgi:hypothetical protein
MDLTESIQANSDQINAEDLIGAPRTVTITKVEAGTKDQPVFIHTTEFPGKTYRPAKSMRRVLVVAWGQDSSAYVGRKITIYNDPTVRWAGQEVGGVRISHLSHITAPLTVALTVTRGKRAPFVVQPIASDPAVHLAALAQAKTLDELHTAWQGATAAGVASVPELVKLKDARKTKLSTPVAPVST